MGRDMGKTTAERQAEYRARRKELAATMRDKGKTRVELWLDSRLAERLKEAGYGDSVRLSREIEKLLRKAEILKKKKGGKN